LQTRGREVLRKYTRSNVKLFGLRFHEPLFGGSASGKGAVFCANLTNGEPADEIRGERANPDDLGSGRRLRRRRRETH